MVKDMMVNIMPFARLRKDLDSVRVMNTSFKERLLT